MTRKSPEHITTWEDWTHWRKGCTIEKCPPETVERLALFGRTRLRAAMQKLNASGTWSATVSPDNPNQKTTDWLCVEAFLLAGHTTIEGPSPAKRYKDRILESAGNSLSAMEGCLTRMIQRDLFRRLAYEEGDHFRGKDGLVKAYYTSRDDTGNKDESPSKPGATAASASSSSLIPDDFADPATQADLHEITRLAGKVLSRFIKTLTPDERVILVFDLLDISIRVAIENKLIRVQKSSASDKLQALRQRIATVNWPFKPDPAEETLLFKAFASELVQWANGPENAYLSRFTDQTETTS